MIHLQRSLAGSLPSLVESQAHTYSQVSAPDSGAQRGPARLQHGAQRGGQVRDRPGTRLGAGAGGRQGRHPTQPLGARLTCGSCFQVASDARGAGRSPPPLKEEAAPGTQAALPSGWSHHRGRPPHPLPSQRAVTALGGGASRGFTSHKSAPVPGRVGAGGPFGPLREGREGDSCGREEGRGPCLSPAQPLPGDRATTATESSREVGTPGTHPWL